MHQSVSRNVVPSLIASAFVSAASAAVSTANYAPCGSTEGLGSFRASVVYDHRGGTSATLTIALLNDTGAGLGGSITGIALNGGMGVTSMSFVTCDNRSFDGLSAPVSAAPYGDFMVGAAIGSSWLGGGSPVAGISVGTTTTFVFTMVGSAVDLAMLTAEDCLGGEGYAMAVRFRGGIGDWSDKVVGCAQPAPGAVAMLAAAGLVGSRRRLR